MKFKSLIFILAIIFAVQIAGTVVVLTANTVSKQDAVEINDILQECTVNFDNLVKIERVYKYDFTVIESSGKMLYASKKGLSENINEAIKNRDTILDIVVENELVGKLIVSSNYAVALKLQNKSLAVFSSVMLSLLAATLIIYILYINKRVIKPFNGLTKFAAVVASGNFGTELNMDKHNIFGAFTESFDIMRTELNNAKLAEQKASDSKKLLIANLSHDIKTPVASIKALAEVGEVRADKKDKQSFAMINKKADQVNALVSNLFSASLEEMNQLTINTSDVGSGELSDMIAVADYLAKAKIDEIPEMLLAIDKQRVQQVIDNIISNSYKYSNTAIHISFVDNGKFLRMTIKDFGGYVDSPEKLLSKFYRGQNACSKDGSGLGLYISKYLMTAMGGDLTLDCDKNYFMVIIDIKTS